jgi:hypothetical protein
MYHVTHVRSLRREGIGHCQKLPKPPRPVEHKELRLLSVRFASVQGFIEPAVLEAAIIIALF